MTIIPILNVEYNRIEMEKDSSIGYVLFLDEKKVASANIYDKENCTIALCTGSKSLNNILGEFELTELGTDRETSSIASNAELKASAKSLTAECTEKRAKEEAEAKKQKSEKRKAFFKSISPQQAAKIITNRIKEAKQVKVQTAGKKGWLKMKMALCNMAEKAVDKVDDVASALNSEDGAVLALLSAGVVSIGLLRGLSVNEMWNPPVDSFKLFARPAMLLGGAAVISPAVNLLTKTTLKKLEQVKEKTQKSLSEMSKKSNNMEISQMARRMGRGR